jgi:hypothetical protein
MKHMSDGLAQSISHETCWIVLPFKLVIKVKVLNYRAQVTFSYAKNACLHGDWNLRPSAL